MAMNKEEQARREGMAYALKIAKEKGIEGLEEELRFRNATRIPVAVSRSACNESIQKIKENTIDTIMILSAVTLHDEFGFGEKRIRQFQERFNLKADCIAENYTDWNDQIEILKQECKVEMAIRKNDTDVRC